MARGITFNSALEANEYIKQRNLDGYEAYCIKHGDKIIVYTLGKKSEVHPKIIETDEKYLYNIKGLKGDYNPDENEIHFSRKANTGTKLHEIGHSTLGHTRPGRGQKNINQEIEAEIFSYQKMNKELTWRVATTAIDDAIFWNVHSDRKDSRTGEEIISDVNKILKAKGIENIPANEEQDILNDYNSEKAEQERLNKLTYGEEEQKNSMD